MINLLPDCLENRRQDTQMINVRNDRGDITDPTYIKRVRRECFEQLYPNKFDNLDKIEKFPERHKLPSLFKKTYITCIGLYPLRKLNL